MIHPHTIITRELVMLKMIMNGIFTPAPHVEQLPADQIKKKYTFLRWQVFLSILVGYAAFYLVRNNYGLAMPFLVKLGYTKTQLGLIGSAYAIAYGWSKFIMGNVSDRSNPRYFMAVGLFLSGLVNIFFPVFSGVALMYCMMFMNGWFGGMGYPPSSRTMAHWFSISERGTMMSIWNCSHNIGGGIIAPIAGFAMTLVVLMGVPEASKWAAIFYAPGIMAIGVSFFVMLTLRDTPQSVGLPPIEEFRNDYALTTAGINTENELSAKEILLKYVFPNKLLWCLALSNIFVYTVRYGALNWAPLYLTSVKHISFGHASWAYFLYEFAGIAGTIGCGWISDKFFHSRRSPAIIIFMALAFVSVFLYWKVEGSELFYTLILASVGLLVYGPVGLIGVNALDLVPKKAAGSATGFTGLFGYLFGTTGATLVMGLIMDAWGWNAGFLFLLASCVLAVLFMLPLIKVRVTTK